MVDDAEHLAEPIDTLPADGSPDVTPARHVRRAAERDLDALVSLRACMFEAMGSAGPSVEDERWRRAARRWFEARLHHEAYCLVVVEVDGEPVATATGAVRESAPSPTNPDGRDVLVSNVSTAPGARRRGHARLALAEVMRWARTTGAGRAELLATGPGRSMYEAEGFVVTSHPAMRAVL